MHRAIPGWITFLIAMLLSGVASAATINSVTFVRSTVTINGVGFNGVLTATLNGQKLAIVSSTPTQILATMSTVPDPGSYRLVVKAGKASAFAYVTTTLPTILAGDCRTANWGVGRYVTIWLIGDFDPTSRYEGCELGAHYPPSYGVPLKSGGVLKNLKATGQFAGTATVYINYVPTPLSCTVADYPPSVYAVGCSNTTDRIQVNSGDVLDVGLTPSVALVNNIHASLELQEQ